MYQTGSITKAGLHSVALKKQEALSITAVCTCVHVQVCVEFRQAYDEQKEEEEVVIVCLLLSNDSGRVD